MIVLVVDSSALIIERLQNMLSETATITKIYGAASYKDAAKMFNTIAFNVVLVDGDLPNNKTIDILKMAKKINPDLHVIVLANGIDTYLETKYKALGATYFFDKYHQFEELPSVLSTISKTLTK